MDPVHALGLLGSAGVSQVLIRKHRLRKWSVPILRYPDTRALCARFWMNLSIF